MNRQHESLGTSLWTRLHGRVTAIAVLALAAASCVAVDDIAPKRRARGSGGDPAGDAGTIVSTTSGGGDMGPPVDTSDYPYETEVNDTPPEADVLLAGTKGFRAALVPVGDMDVFAVDVGVGDSLNVKISDGHGGCPPGAYTLVTVADHDGLQIASDLDENAGTCSALGAYDRPELSILPAGRYFIAVETALVSEVAAYVIDIEDVPASCGDGVVQPPRGETCDDGNAISGDGCSATCTHEVVCGDGIAEHAYGEQCDDGNAVSGDGCSATCTGEVACGDGLVDYANGEQCEDGGAVSGDGCSAVCTLEGTFIPEVEPNDASGIPTPLWPGADGAIASLTANDMDAYSLDIVVPGSSVTIAVTDGLGGCPPGFAASLALLSPGGPSVAYDTNSGPGSCPLIQPSTDQGARNLPAATYGVRVNGSQTCPLYVLTTVITTPVCGDGKSEGAEQCDDGNALSGDGCDACVLELAGNFVAESEPNWPPNKSDSLVGFDGATGAISPKTDIDVFGLDVAVPGSSITIKIDNGLGGCPVGFNSLVELRDASNLTIASDNDGGPGMCSLIAPANHPEATNLAAGSYKLSVVQQMASPVPFYRLTFALTPPACGDGILQGLAGELCEDGNKLAGDGCGADCLPEFHWELEPNGDAAHATPLWPGTSSWIGSIAGWSDYDWYALDVPPGASLTVATHTVGDPSSCSFDTVLHVVDPNGVLIDTDDDGGIGACSFLSPASSPGLSALAGGTYFVSVQSGWSTISKYELEVALQ